MQSNNVVVPVGAVMESTLFDNVSIDRKAMPHAPTRGFTKGVVKGNHNAIHAMTNKIQDGITTLLTNWDGSRFTVRVSTPRLFSREPSVSKMECNEASRSDQAELLNTLSPAPQSFESWVG